MSLHDLARLRSPPGAWRLLLPALLAWAAAAFAVAHPGAGRAIAAGAASLALALLVGATTRVSRLRSLARRVLPFLAVCCAVLVLLGIGIERGERARAEPLLAHAAESRSEMQLDVILGGFPRAVTGEEPPSAWVAAETAGSGGGSVPLVLWLSGDSAASVMGFADAAGDAVGWGPGNRAFVRGRLVQLEAGSSAAYGVRVSSASIAPPAKGPAGLPARAARAAAALRLDLREAASRVPGAALVPGFAVGDTALVDRALDERMRQSSVTHLVAVSGANCALVTGAIVWGAVMLGAGRRTRLALAAAALACFVFVVGPDPSVQRAAVMAVVVLASGFGGKRAVALPALGAAVIVLLLADPWQALQPGFALSVAATAGILLLATPLDGALGRLLRLPRWLRLPLAVALAAQLACGPLLLLLEPGIPAVGVLANVIATPAAPLGTGLGLLALLALPLSAPLGGALLGLAALPARWVAATAEVTADLPLARWPWPQGWPGALLLAGIGAAVLAAWALLALRLPFRADRLAGPSPWEARRPRSTAGRALVAVLLCAAGGAFAGPTLLAPLIVSAAMPDDWGIVACDVGQGDAILLRDRAQPDAVMLVDTGDEPELLRRCLDRFGVQRIALLVLTHDDRDHVGALDEIADAVDAALIAPPTRDRVGVRPLVQRLDAAGIPHRIGARGLAGANGGMSWQILAPAAAPAPADTNAASLVLRAQAGELSVLLLADTGEDEQRALRASGQRLDATVVKVAHHGSRDQDAELPARIGAELALVSVGAENGYGHPSAQTLDAYAAAGTRTARTDRLGSIAVAGAPGALRLWVERGGDRAARDG